MAVSNRPLAGARELTVCRWLGAPAHADGPVELRVGGSDRRVVPDLPSDCERMIYTLMWRAEVQDRAACVIQRAIRQTIHRAQGCPWDLPALELDVLHSLCFGTLLLTGQGDAETGRSPKPRARRAPPVSQAAPVVHPTVAPLSVVAFGRACELDERDLLIARELRECTVGREALRTDGLRDGRM